MPEWPPAKFNYDAALKASGYRQVTTAKWATEPESVDGLKKVCALEHFTGVYRTHTSQVIDVRPKESAPTLRNFQKKSMMELQELLAESYEQQLKQLNENTYDREFEESLTASLQSKLMRIRKIV